MDIGLYLQNLKRAREESKNSKTFIHQLSSCKLRCSQHKVAARAEVIRSGQRCAEGEGDSQTARFRLGTHHIKNGLLCGLGLDAHLLIFYVFFFHAAQSRDTNTHETIWCFYFLPNWRRGWPSPPALPTWRLVNQVLFYSLRCLRFPNPISPLWIQLPVLHVVGWTIIILWNLPLLTSCFFSSLGDTSFSLLSRLFVAHHACHLVSSILAFFRELVFREVGRHKFLAAGATRQIASPLALFLLEPRAFLAAGFPTFFIRFIEHLLDLIEKKGCFFVSQGVSRTCAWLKSSEFDVPQTEHFIPCTWIEVFTPTRMSFSRAWQNIGT